MYDSEHVVRLIDVCSRKLFLLDHRSSVFDQRMGN